MRLARAPGEGESASPAPPAPAGRGDCAPHRARRLCPQVGRRGARERRGRRRPPQVCRAAPAAGAAEAPLRSRLSGPVALLLRVRPPRRRHTDTHSHTQAGTATTRQPV
ncbi:uncharacterized protein PS065_018979 [Dugong dugon]